MNFIQYRAQLCVGITLLFVLLVAGASAVFLMNKMSWADETLNLIEPRFARFLGLQASATEINRAASEVNAALTRYTYASTVGADRIGTDLQQRLRAVAETAGVSITGSQIIPGKVSDGVEDVLVSMAFEADNKQLQDMLAGVHGQTPVIYVDSLMIIPVRRPGVGGKLSVQVRFSVLRRLS